MKDYLNNYCHEQALTLSEIDIFKILCSFRRLGLAYLHCIPLYIVLDPAAWNNMMRHILVKMVNEATTDKVLGVKIFSRTMLGNEFSLIYIPDHGCFYVWIGQPGGTEALNQYTWDHSYIAPI